MINLLYRLRILFFVLSCIATVGLFADGLHDVEEDFSFLGDITVENLDAKLQEHDVQVPTFRVFSPNLMALGLTEIKESLWQHTKAPAGRDILYLLPHKITAVEYGGMAFNLFFNMTDDLKTTIDSLFNLEKQLARADFLDVIEGFLGGKLGANDLAQLLPLFKKLTLQERKAGYLMQTAYVKGPFTVQLNTSFQVGARNFWLNKKDQEEIRAIMREKYGVTTIDEKEFYKIQIGMGDTRVKFGLNALNMTSLQIDIGLETILPTSRFSNTPTIKLGIAQAAFDTEEAQKKALEALRAVRDYILNPHIGNGGHWGLGCYFESKIGMFHELAQLWIRASYDVLFPNEEDRLFMFKKTLSPDDIDPRVGGPFSNLGGAVDTPEKRERLNEYIRQYAFPSSFKATVVPGGVLNFVAAINVDFTKRIRGALGYDFYAQGAETIKSIHNTTTDINSLRVTDAQSPSVYQHKIFTEYFYHNKKKDRDLGIGFGGDMTVSSQRIGEDWTVYLKALWSF